MTDSQSKFGRQPFQKILDEQGRTISGTGRYLGFDGGYFMRVACGRVPPTQEMRRALSEFLDMPVETLFSADALAAEYRVPANARGFREVEA